MAAVARRSRCRTSIISRSRRLSGGVLGTRRIMVSAVRMLRTQHYANYLALVCQSRGEVGLKGAFEIDLEYSPDQTAADKPSIFTAVQEQLGLKLESTKAPVERSRDRSHRTTD